jgi:hypothetical protein
MIGTEPPRSLADERLDPLIPVISENGGLTDLELAAVCLAILLTPGIDLTCREALERWLDSTHPPPVGELLLASVGARRAPAVSL